MGLLFTFAGNEGHLQTMPKPTKPLLQRQDLECRRSGDGAGIRQAETLADQPPHTRIRGRRRAFGGRLHAHRTAEPPQDEDIPIATFEILDGQHLGAVDQCGVRARIYSQVTFLEIISCLVSKIDDRLSEIPAPSGGRPQRPQRCWGSWTIATSRSSVVISATERPVRCLRGRCAGRTAG